MDIIALSVSVNYDDILKHLIEQNSKFFLKWFIITSPEDTKTIELIKGMNGVYGLFLAVIGPNSVVPYHTDDRSNNTNTILIGVRVPSTNVDDVGFEINSTKYNIDKSIIFSSSIPHKAWNNTNQWWVSAILIADINTLKLKDTA